MASLGGQTVASSFDRLLTLPAGGGDGANLIALTDGNEGTTFTLKLSTGGISIEGGDKLYLDGGGDTYIYEAEDDRIELWAGGQMMLWCDKAGGDNDVEVRATLFKIRNESGDSPMIEMTPLHPDSTGTTHVHTIEVGGTGHEDDVLLLGRADSDGDTNVVLNAKVGIGTHAEYPTGPRSYFHVQGNNGILSEQIHIDPDLGGMLQTTSTDSGWASGYNFGKISDLTTLAGFHGYGSGIDNFTRLSIAPAHDDANGIHWDMDNNRCGIGTLTPNCMLHVAGAFAASGPSETFSTFSATDTTPDVSGANLWKTHASTQTLTDLHGGVAGQIVHIISTAAVTYDVTSTDLKGGSTDLVTASGDSTTWIYDGTYWYLIGFMDLDTDFNAMS